MPPVSARAALLVGLFASALAFRPQVSAIGPLIPELQTGLEVSHTVAGLLGTIPVVCMSLFAAPAALLSARVGPRYALAACLALIACFGILRTVVPGPAGVIALTLPVGIGMGLAGALLPVFVKEHFASRPAFATGVYATGLQIGATLAAGLAVPIAHAAGGWRAALGSFSAATGVLLVAWLVLTVRARDGQTGVRPPHVRLPFASGVVWLLAAVFGLQSLIYYGVTAWLPDVYVERGWSEPRAGLLLAVVSGVGIVTGLAVPWFADRAGSRRLYLASGASLVLAGLLGVVLAPGGGWLWAALVGAGGGIVFSLSLTLPLDIAGRPVEAGAVTGLMLGAGYAVAAMGPLALGAARDATGSFSASLWGLAGAAALLLCVCLVLSGERLGRGLRAWEASP